MGNRTSQRRADGAGNRKSKADTSNGGLCNDSEDKSSTTREASSTKRSSKDKNSSKKARRSADRANDNSGDAEDRSEKSTNRSMGTKRRSGDRDSAGSRSSDKNMTHPMLAALKAGGSGNDDNTQSTKDSQKRPVNPMIAAINGDRQDSKDGRPVNPMVAALGGGGSNSPVGSRPANPMLAALNSKDNSGGGGSPFKLKPIFKAGDFERGALKKTTHASAPSEAEGGMDSVRAQAISDAKKCRVEASEVYPFLRVSGDWVARNKEVLLESGVTHILNMAHTVCKNYHEDSQEFDYLALDVIDSANESITPFLLEAIAYIEKARTEGGCCYVHCHMGVSRSCTVVIAYKMFKDKMSFQEAFDQVKKIRPVASPNAGFIGQLQLWEKTLTEKPSEPQLYRVASHSKKDPSLVVKLCTRDDGRTPVRAKPTELDGRGLFLLHHCQKKRLFLWTGPRCKDRTAYSAAAHKFSTWMVEFLPSFAKHAIIDLNDEPGRKPAFWAGLGLDANDAAEMSDQDVDEDLDKYSLEYDDKAPLGATPAALALKSDNRRRHSKDYLGESAGPVSPGSPDSMSAGNSSFKVQLYAWLDEQESEEEDAAEHHLGEDAASLEWDRIKEYDVDDLDSNSMFVLLLHDRQKAKKDKRGKKTIHHAFLWIGDNLEGRLNEDAGIAKAQSFLDFCCSKTNSPPVKIDFVREDEETQPFWEAFESGY